MKIRKYSQNEHDRVIFASLKTYEKYWKKGYIVSINPGNKLCHDVGGGHFPDLVVWSSNGYVDGTFGTKNTIIVEEVETSETIDNIKANQWEYYSKIGVTFFLIVPRNCYEKAKRIVAEKGINITMIQYYFFDAKGDIKFSSQFENI